MSVSKINKQDSKKEKKIENFSQLKGRNIITYSEDKKEEDFYEAMKEGYKAMALINSQYAEEGTSIAVCPLRYCEVSVLVFNISSGVPAKTTSPPNRPALGPISIT